MAEMVGTRSRVTSPGPQESRDASSNPHRDRQSAPAMQPSSIQHVQSMATAMAELTRQNQELIRELNLRRQHHEENTEGQAQSQGYHFSKGATSGEGDGLDEEGYG